MFPTDRERESQYDILLALGIINLKFLNVLKLQRRRSWSGENVLHRGWNIRIESVFTHLARYYPREQARASLTPQDA